jgi:hypothetical protein
MHQQLQKAIKLWLCSMLLLMGANARSQVVISQVYGGGGNTGATYKNDYIELFNRGNTPVTITGWTVQYASATGSSWNTTLLSGTIAAGGYYLIQGAAGSGGTADLPTPNAVGSLNLGGAAGKVALVNTNTTIPSGTTCPTGATIIDFVGFGSTANCYEGTGPTPAPSNTLAVFRASGGCTDNTNNATDFATGTPNPRNSASPLNSCTPVPALTATPASLTGLTTTQGTASASTSYTLTGSLLGSAPVSVSATANIELSTDNSSFSPTLTLPVSESALSQVIYTRLAGTAPTGAFSGTITHTASSTLATSVTVSGQVNAVNAPLLTASPVSLTGLTTLSGTPSAPQVYSLTAANLTETITITAPAGVEISQSSGSDFGPVLTLPGSTTSAVVYARLSGTTPGIVTGTITHVSGSLSASVAISGRVTTTGATPISIARASIGQSVTVAGRVTVTNQLGSRQLYIQDATGGIVIYSGPTGTDLSTLVQLGDSVQTSGPVTVFSGYTEITASVNTFTVVTGVANRVPTPVAITPDQLPSYQGQLVRIENASLTPVAASFTGGTNYTITAGGQSGTLRISANSPLAGAGQPANPVSVTGIADRFVTGATTVGTNGLQLQPRILADIPGATPASDLTCTVGSGSTLNADQTLDIAAWNFEFFGADAGTISCPGGTTLVYNNFGPTNELLQQTNATTVLTKLNADIIAAEEVSDINRFDAAVKAIPGSYSYVCSDKFSYYFQDECAQTPSGGTVFGPTRLAQKVCVIYNTATVTPVLAETKPLLTDKYNYPADNSWSSGRLPFMFVANVTINGLTQKIHVVALHAKSGSATADYNRRKQDILDLKAELDANYANAKVIILGDYNDKLNGSIASGQQSSYQSFVSDAANYTPLTLPLENQGCSTFNSSASFIDHIITSSELTKGYVSNSAYVLQPFSIPNYGNTTSDHNPVVARFDLSQFVTATAPFSITGVTMVNCATVTAGLRQVSFTPQYAGLSGQPVSFSVVNELLPTTAPGPYTINLYTDNPTIRLRATQAGTEGEASFSYDWLAACTTGGTTPPPTGTFSITGVTMVNCATVTAGLRQVSFTPQYAGLSSQPVSFSVVNELLPTTAPGPYTINLYTDNPVITLKATQSGTPTEASFTYNWLANCTSGNARIGAQASPESVLELRILGNPAQNGQVPVEIRGAAGQPVQLTLTDMRGQVLGTHQVNQADAVERHTFEVSRQSTGLLLLRATTPTQSKTVKVIKGN